MARLAAHDRLSDLMKEITIAGGGLAGLSLAAGLRGRGVPVTVLEAGRYPRHRVCGEFISGVSDDTLGFLGIRDLLEDVRQHRSIRWHECGRLMHRGELPEPALGVSRFILDDRLRQRVEDLGGVVKTGVRAKPEPAEGRVWAAGRRPRRAPWIGLKAHVRGLSMAADLEMHSGTNGYAGLSGVEDGWINVCGLFRLDRSLTSSGPDLLLAYLENGGNHGLAERLRRAEWRDGSFCAVAGFELGRQENTPGLLCIGDSNCMIPPFTGNGMSMAFQAAETASGPLVSWAAGELAWQDAANRVRSALNRRFRRRLAVARTLHRFLLEPSGRSLLSALSEFHMLPFRPMFSLVR
jgi:menaquinone-9 beta-reductase